MLGAAALLFQIQSSPRPGPNDWNDAPRVIEQAQLWREGNGIPEALRRFRQSDGCFGSPMDTAQLLGGIENLQLLVALTLDASVDADTHEEALGRGLALAGPTRFFSALMPHLQSEAQARPSSWLVEVQRRASLRHVVVDGLFIEYADMSVREANAVFDRIERELRSGAPWAQVYERFANQYGYNTGTRTSIGNLGDFVVFPDPALTLESHITRLDGAFTGQGKPLPRRLSRLAILPGAHTPAILRANEGDVLRLEDPNMREHVLYAVREVYDGRVLCPPNF